MNWKSIGGFVAFISAFTLGAFLIQQSAAFGSRANSPAAPAPLVASAQVDLSALEHAATMRCMCDRKGEPETECAEIYSRAREAVLEQVYGDVLAPETKSWASACAPVLSSGECFEFTDGEKCITTNYHVNAASSSFENKEVCTADEARAIEDAFQKGSFAGVDDMLSRILAGEAVPSIEPTGGCAG